MDGEPVVFSREKLAERWECSVATIIRFEQSGAIRRCEKLGSMIRYPMSEVLKCESVLENPDPLSPYERIRYKKAINTLEKKLQKATEQLSKIKEVMEQ